MAFSFDASRSFVSKRVTVPAVAKAAGVAPRTVDNMRKRWKVVEAAAKEITGHWWRDRLDELPEMATCGTSRDRARSCRSPRG